MTEVRLYHPVKQSGPAYSFGKRQKPNASFDHPGPGAYDTPPKYGQPLGGRFFTANKNGQSPNRGVPGPGQYHSARNLHNGPAFTMSKRLSKAGQDIIPGPGNYDSAQPFNAQRLTQAPQYTFGSKYKIQGDINNVGPGQYDPYQNERRGISFGNAKHKNQIQDNPGPGSYSLKDSFDGPKYQFRGRSDNGFKSAGPGPGAYDQLSTNEGKGYAFKNGRRDQSWSKSGNPGPGTYDLDTNANMGGFSIGGGRSQEARSLSPGPGEYSYNSKGGPATSFGTAKRNDNDGNLENPGPGSYSTNDLHSGPKFSMRSKNRDRFKDDVPGPGQYDSHRKSEDGPRYTFPSKGGRTSLDTSPGPGQYDTSAADNKHDSPSRQVFGKSSRKDFSDKKGVPGPGQYSVDPKDNGPQYGFGKAGVKGLAREYDDREFYNIPAAVPIAPPYLVTEENKEKVGSMSRYK